MRYVIEVALILSFTLGPVAYVMYAMRDTKEVVYKVLNN